MTKDLTILSIESSCDDTSVAILKNSTVLSNVTASQEVHKNYGGVVPELASRAHQSNIIPVVHKAIQNAEISETDLDAIAYTQGPGLMGSLLVGASFAKGYALAKQLPLIAVNHMRAHVLAHFIDNNNPDNTKPKFPFLCLTVSGGHTQIVKVKSPLEMEVIGKTLDDAAGEAFDKAAKIMGLPYPGGPLIDKYGKQGNPLKYEFPTASIKGLDFSFSGLKTAFLYFLQRETKLNPKFIDENRNDICASIQHCIIKALMGKLKRAATEQKINQIAIAGGVSANSCLRSTIGELGKKHHWDVFIPKFEYCTDNAAMIGITAYYHYLENEFSSLSDKPLARLPLC